MTGITWGAPSAEGDQASLCKGFAGDLVQRRWSWLPVLSAGIRWRHMREV